MNSRASPARYGPGLIALHWLMLLLIVAVYACIELRELFPRGSETRELLKSWHYMLGLAVFALVFSRMLVRIRGQVPPIVPPVPRWQRAVANLTELVLYLFMIAMPLLGWMILSAESHPVSFFGVPLPALIGENRALAKQLEEIHEAVGNAGYFLVGLHAAAALAHHYFYRDNTLVRMLPSRSK